MWSANNELRMNKGVQVNVQFALVLNLGVFSFKKKKLCVLIF